MAVAAISVPDANAAPTPSGGQLFAAHAQSGTLTPVRGQRGEYMLVLKRPGARVISFADRPRRRFGSEDLRGFVANWSSRFRTSDPNAAIELEHGGRHRDVLLVTLFKPKYDRRANTLTYRVRGLTGRAPSGLRAFVSRADHGLPRSFGHVDLFIDPSDEPSVSVKINVSSPIASGAVVAFTNATLHPGVSFFTDGSINLVTTDTVVALGFKNAPGATLTAKADLMVDPTDKTIRLVVQGLPAGATLTAQAGTGKVVTTTTTGPLSLPTS